MLSIYVNQVSHLCETSINKCLYKKYIKQTKLLSYFYKYNLEKSTFNAIFTNIIAISVQFKWHNTIIWNWFWSS